MPLACKTRDQGFQRDMGCLPGEGGENFPADG